MFKVRRSLISVIFSLVFILSADADEVTDLLHAADGFRLPAGAVRVQTHVELFRDNVRDKERDYEVYIKPGRRSLVVFKSADVMGQKVLMVDSDFWYFLPRTARPVRITPTQKLLGEASAGDIATMTWSEDYEGTLDRVASVVDGVSCQRLSLKSLRKGTTYERIELYVSQADRSPVKADLYLASGKLAKEARFEMGMLDGVKRVVAMKLFDKINIKEVTTIFYQKISPMDIPDQFYNPAFLTNITTLPTASE